jgi:hypothetical protein
MDKAILDGGPERVKEILAPINEAFESGEPEKYEGPGWWELLSNAGYECQEPTAPPTPAELDKTYEKPNPRRLEQQCSPESNASPAFREKYC